MKVLIVEDEKAAMRSLRTLLIEIEPRMEVVGDTDSIVDTICWFRTNPMPDLVFMDIHLADGSAFEIFEYVEVSCPVIFTTAYDEYALKAFKVNAVDYLLKPIGKEDVERALRKWSSLCRGVKVTERGDDRSWSSLSRKEYLDLLRKLRKEAGYRTQFLVPVKGDKLLPLAVENILYFHISNGSVKAVTDTQEEFDFPQALDDLAESLDPSSFFRINRQYLISKRAVKDIDLWFNGRLAVNLKVPVEERILVSKARVSYFKDWISA